MSEVYDEVKAYFANDNEVVVNVGKGAQGIKYGKKLFTMFYKGDLVVKLSPERVTELVSNDQALPHDVGTGSPMKDWAKFPVSMKNQWIKFCKESKSYVIG